MRILELKQMLDDLMRCGVPADTLVRVRNVEDGHYTELTGAVYNHETLHLQVTE